MTTVRQIVTKSLQKSGVLTKGEAPDGDEMKDGFEALNAMLSSWSNGTLLNYYQRSINFPLSSGQSEYTIGVGGNFDTVRPIQIASAYVRIGDIDYDLKVINGQAYDLNISYKDLGSIPEYIFYDNNFPLGKLTIWPVPSGGYTLFLRTEDELVQFPSIDSDVSLPPGWERALIYNLAVETASDYGQEVPQVIAFIARESKASIMTSTARNRNMDMLPLSGMVDNIYSGWWNK